LNFSKAAEELYVTAQGLNVSISRMEKDLNTKLFMRTSKGLVLTENGFRLKETAAIIVSELQNYQNKLQNRDTIYVASMHHVYTILPPMVQRLLFCLDSQFSVDLSELLCEECEDLLLKGEVDFTISAPMVSSPEISTQKLFTARIMIIVNQNSPFASGHIKSIETLDKVSVLTTNEKSKTCQLFMACCREKMVVPNFVFNVAHPTSIAEIVRINPEIVGIFPEYFLAGLCIDNLSIYPFEMEDLNTDMSFDLSLNKNMSRVQSSLSMKFENYLLSLIRSNNFKKNSYYHCKKGVTPNG